MTWDALPGQWEDAPFLGNGQLGAMVWRVGDRALCVQLGHSAVCDHRDCAPEELLFYRCRLPVGRLVLALPEALEGSTMRLCLRDATLTLRAGNRVLLRLMVLADRDLLVLRHRGQIEARFEPDPAMSPRQRYGIEHGEAFRVAQGYVPNPAPWFDRRGDVRLCVQDLLCGGRTVSAWRQADGLLVATVCHSAQDGSALNEALRLVGGAPDDAAHLDFWRAFYQSHELSIPDERLMRFYWAQMYKLGSATRPGGRVMDNQGPWLQETPWPATWWNLNVQLAYSPVFASNHLELFEPVWRALHDHLDQLVKNVPEAYRHDSAAIGAYSDGALFSKVAEPGADEGGLVEIGNLTWALHACWRYYRMTMDDALLRALLPLLARSAAYALHFLREGEDGRLHLLPTASPEYGVVAPDTNYELALLNWALGALLWGHERLGLNHPRLQEWRHALANLCDYPKDAQTGFHIARGVPYEKSHRHYSHLLMAYPLYLVNIENGGRGIIETSLRHWQSKKEALRGYSCTGAASIACVLGEGDLALSYLNGLWDGLLLPNTLYKEDGPVIETPLSAAECIHDMLLSSWGGAIRVFPALPSGWKDVSFKRLLAEGAFLVSAELRGGRMESIEITSLAGEPCVLVAAIEPDAFDCSGAALERVGEGRFQLALGKGETWRMARKA